MQSKKSGAVVSVHQRVNHPCIYPSKRRFYLITSYYRIRGNWQSGSNRVIFIKFARILLLHSEYRVQSQRAPRFFAENGCARANKKRQSNSNLYIVAFDDVMNNLLSSLNAPLRKEI